MYVGAKGYKYGVGKGLRDIKYTIVMVEAIKNPTNPPKYEAITINNLNKDIDVIK